MPDPDVSNLERLLRLIDGGPEVVKEVQQQREVPPEKKPVPVVPSSASPKPKATDTGTATAAKMAAAGALVLCMVLSVVVLLRAWPKQGHPVVPPQNAVPAAAEKSYEDTAGAGVRLVGVDWGEPPVALLEDLKTGKTYFVKKNDKVRDLSVKQIFKDKVVASFHGRNVELR